MEMMMGFLWFVGWVFTLGVHKEACDVAKEKNRAVYCAVIFLFWPHYLGYSMALKNKI